MKDYAITHYSASTYTIIPLAIVAAESYGQAWERYVARYGAPKGNHNDLGVVTAREEHYKLHGVAVPRI